MLFALSLSFLFIKRIGGIMPRCSYIDYDGYNIKELRRIIEDFIEEYNNKDPIFEASCGHEFIIPHTHIEIYEMSNDEVVEEYIRLKSLGYLR